MPPCWPRILNVGVIGVCIKWSIDYILKDMSVMPYTVVALHPPSALPCCDVGGFCPDATLSHLLVTDGARQRWYAEEGGTAGMIHVGIAIAILMGSLLLGVSIPFAFGAGTIYMYTMLGGTFCHHFAGGLQRHQHHGTTGHSHLHHGRRLH